MNATSVDALVILREIVVMALGEDTVSVTDWIWN